MPEPPLYNIVDFAYHTVMDKMPQALQDRDMASAFFLGSMGMYYVVKGLQWSSKKVDQYVWPRMPNFVKDKFPSFDEDVFPQLEKICVTGMAVAPFVYATFDPNGAKEIMTQHPTYTSGMGGVWALSIAGALKDIYRRHIQKSLEEKL